MPKRFAIPAHRLRPLATGHGSCFATDRITVAARRVGYMYREAPGGPGDSGWRFFAGDETQDYTNDPANVAIYDVNTIANYDPDIIPLLDTPAPAAFIRLNASGPLVPDPGHQPRGD